MIWIIVGIFIAFVLFITLKPFQYWAKKGVPQSSLYHLWVDNVKVFFQFISPAENTMKLHKRFDDERYVGTCHFFNPLLLLRDPELIKQIGIKEFDHFIDRVQFANADVDPLLAKSLFLLRGDQWRAMRAVLSPSFTSSKMKGMFGLVKDCAENFVKFYEKDKSASESICTKDAFSRYTNDVIASAAFGVTCNSLQDPNNEFYVMGKKATDFSGFWRNISVLLIMLFPKTMKLFGVRAIAEDVSSFFRKLIKNNIEEREKNGIIRPDMIHLLMEARKGKLKHDENVNREVDAGFAMIEESDVGKADKFRNVELSDDDLTAQALVFFFAGFDSSSSLMSFLAYELAVNPEIQQRLQGEIDATLKECNGSVTYEALFKMKYLDMVVSETLRKWPNLTAVDRICVRPYTIEPVRETETPVKLSEGDLLWIPLYAIHRDPKYYPEPDRFDPERFSEENKSSINQYAYLPFGLGPRSCIGNRFALMETKLLFFSLLSKFNITVVDKTDIPLVLCKKQFNLAASNGIWVGFQPRQFKS